MTTAHIPVLLNESIAALSLKTDGVYVDATLGGGSHSHAILSDSANVKLYAFDQDSTATRKTEAYLAEFRDRLTIICANFANMRTQLALRKVKQIDGILFDLGMSSDQLDTSGRGFSYVADDSLDMRMDILTETTAADIVNNSSREELHKIFFEYGEERESGKIAAAIVRLRQDSPVSTSGMLAKIIDDTVTSHRKNKAKARIFQALRIAVNKELEVLQSALEDAVHLLNPTGRIVVLSYHSLEDRIVKHFFREQEKDCICPSFLPVCQCSKQSVLKVITRKPITPTGKEIEENPRARSAKMRIAEKKARTA